MAKHKYDGTWRYFENPAGGDDVFTQGKDMKLKIPKEDGVVDKNQSSHDGKEISGDATNNGVTLTRGGSNPRKFYGVTVFEVTLRSGDIFAVIKGKFVDSGGGATQVQGDWIITKP